MDAVFEEDATIVIFMLGEPSFSLVILYTNSTILVFGALRLQTFRRVSCLESCGVYSGRYSTSVFGAVFPKTIVNTEGFTRRIGRAVQRTLTPHVS
jgi:hypothetical protein